MSKTILKKENETNGRRLFAISITSNVFIRFIILIRQLHTYQTLNTKHSACSGDNFELTDLHINNLRFKKK